MSEAASVRGDDAAGPTEEARLHIARILASASPSETLLEVLAEMQARPAVAVAIYEIVAPRIKIKHYWVYYRISCAYFLLGRDDACFATAVSAIQAEPEYQNWHMFENIYRYFRAQRQFRAAAEIARHQIAHTPEIPIVSPFELANIERAANMPSTDSFAVDADRTKHPLHAASVFKLATHRRYGAERDMTKCFALDAFKHAQSRPEVVVWELESPEIVLFDRNILIFNEKKTLQSDISVCEFPEALARKITDSAVYDTLVVRDVEDALVIGDKYGTANVCHFLLDHITRLALYEPFSTISEALVIGPSLVTEYQERIARRIGVKAYQGTGERCIIRPSRLFVSETCKKTFVHPAHFAAGWALCYLKQRFVFERFGHEATRRIYISRKDAAVRFVRNEAAVLERLRDFKFEEIILSHFDYEEQAALFARSTHVVGMHGAGLTNMVFCPSGAHFLEICHPVSGTAAYAVIGSALNVQYAALVGRDADSDEAMYNDAAAASLGLGMGGAQVLSNRDVIVDLAELDRWLHDSGVSP